MLAREQGLLAELRHANDTIAQMADKIARHANDRCNEKDGEIQRLRAALERISKCEDAPDIDATGEWQTGLYCGVEDRDCQDRYQGADYGHAVGVEKGLEWASNEAKRALAGKKGEELP